MKQYLKYIWLIPLAAMSFSLSSCTTDSYGNTTVTPGGAAAIGVGALAAGAIVGAAIQDNHNDKHHNYGPPPPPPRRHYHYDRYRYDNRRNHR